MDECSIIEGVVIGASGGALAGVTLYLVQLAHQQIKDHKESKRIHTWLENDTQKDQFRSTRAIASWTNLPIERVQYLCSHDDKIKLSTGEKEDMWALRSKISEPTFE